jgi:hypothetical protein
MPESTGTRLKKVRNACMPPADAPIPTMKRSFDDGRSGRLPDSCVGLAFFVRRGFFKCAVREFATARYIILLAH